MQNAILQLSQSKKLEKAILRLPRLTHDENGRPEWVNSCLPINREPFTKPWPISPRLIRGVAYEFVRLNGHLPSLHFDKLIENLKRDNAIDYRPNQQHIAVIDALEFFLQLGLFEEMGSLTHLTTYAWLRIHQFLKENGMLHVSCY